MAVDILEEPEEPAAVPFVIKDIQYTDKIVMTMMTLPEKQEELVVLLANITSGSAEILGKEILLEKI